jgi:glycosyltransferase involved in cell wall biosynthesis
MSQGLPVIATDIPGSRELALPGETGMLFPQGDSEALAERLEALILNPDLAKQLGRGGRDFVQREGLTAVAIARRHIELYRDVIRQH